VTDTDWRIGLGYDIHRLVQGRRLVLGGVEFDHPTGLDGHSDADVLLHAIMDALLGAAGLGDIGHHFPNDDERWRDASSLDLLARVKELLNDLHWRVANIDATLVAEQPKMGPRVAEMITTIAECLSFDPNRVNIKATTAEGTGAEGRCEAISAQAVALLSRET
jgi:2-C-methyl-D-erythritol 2,4-cyclodiphosphate synthase